MLKHIIIVEDALGKFLLPPHVVHHVNHNILDNANRNLVACEDQAYHMLLHKRARAYDACGHADWLKCVYCEEWDSPDNLYVHPSGSARHRSCHAESVASKKRVRLHRELLHLAVPSAEPEAQPAGVAG